MSDDVFSEVQTNTNTSSAPDHYHKVNVQGSIGFNGEWVLRKFLCDGTGDTINLERRIVEEVTIEAAEPTVEEQEESKPVLRRGRGWEEPPEGYIAPQDFEAHVPKADLNAKGARTRAASRQEGPSSTRARSSAVSLTAHEAGTRDNPTSKKGAAHSNGGLLPKRKRSEPATQANTDRNALNDDQNKITVEPDEDQAPAKKARAKRTKSAPNTLPKPAAIVKRETKRTKKTTANPAQEPKKNGRSFPNLPKQEEAEQDKLMGEDEREDAEEGNEPQVVSKGKKVR